MPSLDTLLTLTTQVLYVAVAGVATGIYLANCDHDRRKYNNEESIPLFQQFAGLQRAMAFATWVYGNKVLMNGKNELYYKHVVRIATKLSEAGVDDHIPLMGRF